MATKQITDQNGFITINKNPISKSGVFDYLGSNISSELEPNKIYKVWRPEAELNNPETIESFKLVPWIPYHEMLGEDFTPAESVGVQGITGEEVVYENGTLFSKLKIIGEDLKQQIKAGLKELSCGFRCMWDLTPGITPEGDPYDVVQRQIRGNHLASVPQGRMGSEVAVMDRAVFALDHLDLNKIETKPDGDDMKIEELVELVKQQSEQITTISSAMDAMGERVKSMAEDKKAKDEDMEEEGEAEDEDEDEKDDKKAKDKYDEKSKAMDSKIESLVGVVEKLSAKVDKVAAMDGASIIREVSEKNELADQASKIVGAFDHSDMDKSAVAKYALEKMGVACDSGSEVAMFKGILHAKSQPRYIDDGYGQDSKSGGTAHLDALNDIIGG